MTLVVKLLPIMEVCTSLLSSMDLTHLQQVSSSPCSLAAVIIALKEVLSNAPSMSMRSINLLFLFGIRRNCLGSGRSQSFNLPIRRAIKQIVVIIEV
jgi:hypothetical protein